VCDMDTWPAWPAAEGNDDGGDGSVRAIPSRARDTRLVHVDGTATKAIERGLSTYIYGIYSIFSMMKVIASHVARAVTTLELVAGVELMTKAYGVKDYPRFVTTEMKWLCVMMKTPSGAFMIAMLGAMLVAFGAGAAMKMYAPSTRVGEVMFTAGHALTCANCYAFRATVAGVWPIGAYHAVAAALFRLGDMDLMSLVPVVGSSTKGGKGKKSSAGAKKAVAPKRSSSRASRRR